MVSKLGTKEVKIAYRVYYKAGAILDNISTADGSIEAQDTKATIKNLIADTQYTFKVVAIVSSALLPVSIELHISRQSHVTEPSVHAKDDEKDKDAHKDNSRNKKFSAITHFRVNHEQTTVNSINLSWNVPRNTTAFTVYTLYYSNYEDKRSITTAATTG